MSQRYNELGQPIGAPLPDWSPRPFPPRTPIEGRFCRVEPLDAERHAAELFKANSDDLASEIRLPPKWLRLRCRKG
jgi:hypothetical protein